MSNEQDDRQERILKMRREALLALPPDRLVQIIDSYDGVITDLLGLNNQHTAAGNMWAAAVMNRLAEHQRAMAEIVWPTAPKGN